MSVIQFESIIVEGNLIRIPEQDMEQIPDMVTVTLGHVENPRYSPKTKKRNLLA